LQAILQHERPARSCDSDTTYFDEIDQDRRVCLALCLNRQLRHVRSAGGQVDYLSNDAPSPSQNVVSFFKAAKFRATEVQPRCAIFFEGEWKSANVYNYGVIMVENSDQDIQVTFYLTDAHEMNWVTEFLDSQFFNRNETEKLFQLMNARSDVRSQNVGRFLVDFHHWQPRHAQLLVFSFTPVRSGR
jgi:hypothetical protein